MTDHAMRAPRTVLAAAAALCFLSGCSHTQEHVFDDRPRDDVWLAMQQAAKEPRYSNWIVTDNKVHVSQKEHTITVLRQLKRDVVETGLKPRREEEEWRFAATLTDTDPATVVFSSPEWSIPAHFWLEADHYFAQVRMRLGEMGPVTPAPGDPMGGAPASAPKDPAAPGDIPATPVEGKLAAP